MGAIASLWSAPFAAVSFPTSDVTQAAPSYGVARVVEIVPRTTWHIVFSVSGAPPDLLNRAAFNIGVIFGASAAVADRGFFTRIAPVSYPEGPAIEVSALDTAGAPVSTDGVLWVQAFRTGPTS